MPALDSIEVQGYKSIRSAKIELGAINVLIGANGAGKSNLLSLFGLLADLADARLQLHVARQGGADALLHFGRKNTASLTISLRFGNHVHLATLVPAVSDTLVFGLEISSPREVAPSSIPSNIEPAPLIRVGHKESALTEVVDVTEAGPKPEQVVAKSALLGMKSWRKFHFHDTGPSAPAKQKRKVDDNRALRAEGDNLAPFLFALRTVAPGAYRRIVEAIRAVAPCFDDFVLAPDLVNPDVIQLAWRHTTDDSLCAARSARSAGARPVGSRVRPSRS